MTSEVRATFRDAYLVDAPASAVSADGAPIGVVRRDRHVWRVYLFGVEASSQPRQALATREEAGRFVLAAQDVS